MNLDPDQVRAAFYCVAEVTANAYSLGRQSRSGSATFTKPCPQQDRKSLHRN